MVTKHNLLNKSHLGDKRGTKNTKQEQDKRVTGVDGVCQLHTRQTLVSIKKSGFTDQVNLFSHL